MKRCSRKSEKWPPDYYKIYVKRQKTLLKIENNPNLLRGAKELYRKNPAKFIEDWGITYDPRNSPSDLPTKMPFILFQRQRQLIDFLMECLNDQESGLVEKTRDMGATWLCCLFSIWLWLFVPGASIGWGSRKEILVDKLGDPDSIFEKMRMALRFVPKVFWPAGFTLNKNATYMRIINTENGSTITGEAGDNIGRGGRKLIFFSDESAHYERPDLIEAALSHNTNVRIDLSSVNGAANVFARKRRSGEVWNPGRKIAPGKTRVFILDWRDHPLKTQQWYDTKRDKAEREGLTHIFAQEVDRDYIAAIERIVIPAKFVKAAIDAHKILNIKVEGHKIAALDVADEGGDKNALTVRQGIVCLECQAWAEGDTGDTTKKTVRYMRSHGCLELQYDSIGVGSGIKASINLLKKTDSYIKKIVTVKWIAGAKVLHPDRRLIKNDKDTPKNSDFFKNLKAQAWWNARVRFEKTYNAIVKGVSYDPDELISIDSCIEDLHELTSELSQPTYISDNAGKIVINKKPTGTRSPNRADSFIMCYWPLRSKRVMI